MANQSDAHEGEHGTSSPILIGAAWALVGIPWAWGLLSTLNKAVLLFTG